MAPVFAFYGLWMRSIFILFFDYLLLTLILFMLYSIILKMK